MMSAYSHYLPVEADALKWGLSVTDCGHTDISPGSDYPSSKHPLGYMFSWEKGRVLSEYQIVYITEGRGTFDSGPTGRVRIEKGHVFLLFPDVWHRYRPIKKEGWSEDWIGFSGEYAQRLMGEFFTPQKPCLRIGHDTELLDLMKSTATLLEQAPAGYQQLMAARTVEVLARIRMLNMSSSDPNNKIADIVHQARHFLLTHSDQDVDMKRLAAELGLSYSRFRAAFKNHTGTSPHQYLLEVRINKARDYLKNTDLSISAIADKLGFTSTYYFSRLFRKKTGHSPRQHRTL